MKAVEFPVVAEAKRAAQGQMRFFNSMLAAKTASNSSHKASGGVPVKQAVKRRATSEK
jgi:hypothetical protein